MTVQFHTPTLVSVFTLTFYCILAQCYHSQSHSVVHTLTAKAINSFFFFSFFLNLALPNWGKNVNDNVCSCIRVRFAWRTCSQLVTHERAEGEQTCNKHILQTCIQRHPHMHSQQGHMAFVEWAEAIVISQKPLALLVQLPSETREVTLTLSVFRSAGKE